MNIGEIRDELKGFHELDEVSFLFVKDGKVVELESEFGSDSSKIIFNVFEK